MAPPKNTADTVIVAKTRARSIAAGRLAGRNGRITALLERQRLLEEDLAQVKKLLNHEVPVNHLPEELLCEIFYHVGRHSALGQMVEDPDASHWRVLRLVCHHWDAVISTTPRFWRSIRVHRTSEWLALCLSRSQNASTSISFDLHALPPKFPSPDCRLSEVLRPHIQCVRSLQILNFDARWTKLLHALDRSMHALRELSLRQGSIRNHPATSCAIPETLPHLQLLSIVGPVDVQGVSQCRDLRELTLQHIPAASLSSLIVLLSANRSLRKIIVSDKNRSEEMPIALPSPINETVTLPELRKLKLETSSHDLASEILRRFRFPSATEVEITFKARGDSNYYISGPQLLHAILVPDAPSLDVIFPKLRETIELNLFSNDDTTLTATGPEHRISIALLQLNLSVPQLPLALSDIIRVLPVAPVSVVTIHAGFGLYPEYEHPATPAIALWQAFFAASPHLETLALRGHGGYHFAWTGLLNASIAATRAMGSPCCPRLHTVSVDDDLICDAHRLRDVVSSMVEALRYRKERGLRLGRLLYGATDRTRRSNGTEVQEQLLGSLVGSMTFMIAS